MNVGNIHNCFGCGLCSVVCPKKIIDIRLSADGFYEPEIIDLSSCVDCGLCVNVCSYSNEGVESASEMSPRGYAAWSNDWLVRRKSSSGGTCYELAKSALDKGFMFCGVRYNVDKVRAEHYVARDLSEMEGSLGSKYIQSYTVDAFRQIDRKDKCLVVGTPCQIDSFRRYIRKFRCEDNFVLVDFFCHGVPSMLTWRKYVREKEKKTGRLSYVSWRNKFMGKDGAEDKNNVVNWHYSYNLLLVGERRTVNSLFIDDDPFFCMFINDVCLGKACYHNCKFKKTNSAADIRIGDFWGEQFSDNVEGVNSVLSFTEKGDELLHSTNCHLTEFPVDSVTERQMSEGAVEPFFANKAWTYLRNPDAPLSRSANMCIKDRRERLLKRNVKQILKALKLRRK